MIQIDWYFSTGLKPPTRQGLYINRRRQVAGWMFTFAGRMNLSMVDDASGNTYSPTMEPENVPLEEEIDLQT